MSFTAAFKTCIFVGLRRQPSPVKLRKELKTVSIRMPEETRNDLLKLKPSGRPFVSFIRDVLEVSLKEPAERVE